MDFRQLDYFIKVYESGSFNSAASKNYISSQGINSSILKLENELGRKLFIRTNTGVKATPEGEFLYKKAVDIMNIINECQSYFKKGIVNRPLIKISYITQLLTILPDDVYTLLSNDSQYSVLLRPSGGALSCEADLSNDYSVFAFVNGPATNAILNYDYCFTKKRVLITNRNNPMVKKSQIYMKDLKDSEFIIVDSTYKTHHEFIEICKKNGFAPNIFLNIDNLSTTYKLIRNNENLIGQCFDFYIEDNYDEMIVVLPVIDLDWPWDIYLAYRNDRHLGKAEQDFRNDILSCF